MIDSDQLSFRRKNMETLESVGIFLAGLGLLLAGLSGSIFLLSKTDEMSRRTKATREETKQE
jgi:hypothetical protein